MLHEYIQTLADYGVSQSDIARESGITRQRVHQLVKNYHNSGRQGRKKKYYKLEKPCYLCLSKATVLHHKDGNNANDKSSNLVQLCNYCHYTIHRTKVFASLLKECTVCKEVVLMHISVSVCRSCTNYS